MERNPFLVSLDNDDDEAGVRQRLASFNGYQDSCKPLVAEWIRERVEARATVSSSKCDAREIETLSIAKEANAIAHLEAAAAARSARYAMYAALIAAIGAIISVKSEIYALILKYLL